MRQRSGHTNSNIQLNPATIGESWMNKAPPVPVSSFPAVQPRGEPGAAASCPGVGPVEVDGHQEHVPGRDLEVIGEFLHGVDGQPPVRAFSALVLLGQQHQIRDAVTQAQPPGSGLWPAGRHAGAGEVVSTAVRRIAAPRTERIWPR